MPKSVNIVVSILVALTLVLSGCSDMRILEDLGFIHSVGYDLAEDKEQENNDKNLLVTFRVTKAEADGKKGSETLTTMAISSKEARKSLNRQTNNLLVSGQLRNAMFGLSYAKDGIWNTVDTFLRDSTIGWRLRLSVVNGSVHDILEADFNEHPDTGQYIDILLEKEVNENMVPESNLFTFSRDLLDKGIDPVLPIIKLGKKGIIIDGIGIFCDDRYVTKIDPNNSILFFFMYKNFKEGELSMKLQSERSKKEEIILLSQLISKRKVKVKADDPNHIKVNIEVDILGSLLEYIGELDVSKEKSLHKIEKSIAEHIEKSMAEIIKDLQQAKADSLGIGRYVRNKLSAKQWEQLNWREVYPTVDISVQAKVKVRDTGTSRSGEKSDTY